MNMPDPVNAVNGMGQGPSGFGQGAIGSQVGQSQGPGIGIDRAATGGPNMDQATPGATSPNATATNATSAQPGTSQRKTQDFLGSIGGILSATGIPGLTQLGGLATGISASKAQNAANAAASAATTNEVNIAQQLDSGPNLAPLIQQEQAGMTQAVNNANTANPGKTLLDAFGTAFTNAIGGVASSTAKSQEAAADIYGNVGKSATAASQAIGNPWSALGTSMQGQLPSLNPSSSTASGNEGGLGTSFTGAGVLPAALTAASSTTASPTATPGSLFTQGKTTNTAGGNSGNQSGF